MAAQATFTLNDGQATPAARTFTASGVDGKRVATWYSEYLEASPIGRVILTSSSKPGAKTSDPVRFQAKLVMPIVQTETINGVNSLKLVRQLFANLDLVIPASATTAERRDFMEFISNFTSIFNSGQCLGVQVRDMEPLV